MKVLYCNPIFLDYRIPFYKKLNELFNGNFQVLYSPNRYRGRYDTMLTRIEKELDGVGVPFNGDHIYCIEAKKFDVIPSGNKGPLIPFTFGLLKAIRRQKPDVLITEGFFQWTPKVLLYSFLFRIPVYMGYERTPYTERNVGRIKNLHRKITDKFIKGYLANGSETKKYLISIGVDEKKIFIGGMSADGTNLRKGISEMTLDEKGLFRSRFNCEKGLLYLFTGYLIERKGVKHLLASWVDHIKKHPNDCLVLVGGGDQLDECREMYKNYPSIYFEGRVEYSTIHRYYAVADVFILPTIEDNWSLVVPEAMSCGLPVATSIYNGCHVELVQNNINGFTFDTYKHETIVDVLDKFHYVDLKEFGRKSFELEKEFNTENSAMRVFIAING